MPQDQQLPVEYHNEITAIAYLRAMLITPDVAQLNTSGTLSPEQLRKVKRKGITQLIAGCFFLVLVPASVLMADINWGPLLIIWLIAGLFFAGVFLWSAKGYLAVKADGHNIQSLSGVVSLKNSGNKHVMVKINERGFLLMKNESASLRDGEIFTLYYLEDPRMVIGWTKDSTSVESQS